MSKHIVDGEAGLAQFRARYLSPAFLNTAIDQYPVVLINVPVGVGKSRALDDLVDELRRQERFDVVVVLSELTSSLLERRLIQRMPADVRRLKPRPKEDCGQLDKLWRNYERLGCTAYAREHVCRQCLQYGMCFWPRQYGVGLRGGTVIFGTHAQMQANPYFIQHIRMVTKADNILLILDEAGFLEVSLRITLDRLELCDTIEALRTAKIRKPVRDEWMYHTMLLTQATTSDLRRSDWTLPYLRPPEIVAIQEAGLALSPQFRWAGYQLQSFTRSQYDRRWADQHGIHFVCPPFIADHTVILSADMNEKYVKRQLRIEVVHNPIPPHVIQHQQTLFYNICSLHGAASLFPGNQRQILDAFAQLILRNIKQGRLTVLVSRKYLKLMCIQDLVQRLAQWGEAVELISYAGGPITDVVPNVIPVIHYGLCGINNLEMYNAIYCLNSYYIDEDVLRRAIADVDDDDLRFPVRIKLGGSPRRRVAGSYAPRLRATDADETCRTYYRQLEANVVIQAVGRVRYTTRPREVITFQASEMPGVNLAGEFSTLGEMRQHFGLLTGSEFTRQLNRRKAAQLRKGGQTTRQIAAALGVSERTIRNWLSTTTEAGS